MYQKFVDQYIDILSHHKVEKAVISPGSRNAPLTVGLARNSNIKCYSISDERSAAFIAFGMAQASKKPVILCCTSGSAALNYGPAIAEAYFQEIPLIVLTADRPPEWIDQWDGQTIRQQDIYGKHVLKSYNLSVELQHRDAQWQAARTMNEACINAINHSLPVHINIPFREPFYPKKDYQYTSKDRNELSLIRTFTAEQKLSENQIATLKQELSQYSRIAILLGQDHYSAEFLGKLENISLSCGIPIFADILSNAHSLDTAIKKCDSVFINKDDEELIKEQPDLLISFGKSIISKNLKLYLRANVTTQWHIKTHSDFFPDPFQALTKVITAKNVDFLSVLEDHNTQTPSFYNYWKSKNKAIETVTDNFFSEKIINTDHSEFVLLRKVLKRMNKKVVLHLSNSLSVRYINYLGINKAVDAIYVNRGTSGIDGTTSTAVGHANHTTDQQHMIITGDVAFFYDRNAFWNTLNKQNLKIVLLNNHGGSIFRMIPGPKEQPELEEFFETKQHYNASYFCRENEVEYFELNSNTKFDESVIEQFFSKEGSALLEITTKSVINEDIFQTFKNYLRNGGN